MATSNTEIEIQTIEYTIDYDTIMAYIATNIATVNDPAQQFTMVTRSFPSSGPRDTFMGNLKPGDSLVFRFTTIDGPINVG